MIASAHPRQRRDAPRVSRVFWAVMAVAVTVYAARSVTGAGGSAGEELFAGWYINLLHLAATAALVARVVLVRRDRLAWAFIAAALACWTVGEIVWWEWLRADATPPVPSTADGFWLLFPPLNFVGLVLLARKRVGRVQLGSWLDGLIGALCVAALSTAIVLPPLLSVRDEAATVTLTHLAYPLGDVLLLSAVVWVLGLTGWRPDRDLTLLLAGFSIAAVVDSVWVYRSTQGLYENGALMDILWPATGVVIAFAAWQDVTPRTAAPTRGLPALVLPAAFSLIAIGIVLAHELWLDSHGAVWLAALALAAAIARMGVTAHDNLALADARRQALHDSLTGLPNRTLFRDRVAAALADSRRHGSGVAVIVMDVDRFKEVNDSLGHHHGDRLLVALGERLRHVLREGDTIARLGGDEFALLLPHVDDAAATVEVAEALRATIAQPIHLGELRIDAEASMGIALAPEHGNDVDTLIRHADVAMYVAKREHAGSRVYDPAEDEHSPERLRLAAELRGALQRDELLLHFQPRVELATGRVVGVEALIRWNHPERGLLLPAEFVPLAERTSLIDPLTQFVLGSALSRLCEWDRSGHGLAVSVNLSARHLIDLEVAARIGVMLERHNVDPGRLELEITESMLMVNPARAIEVVGRLKALGVRLAIDDFGVGHASLNYVARLPVDAVKIDRSFVRTMLEDERNAAIVRSVIELGEALEVEVVAEGVENERIAEALRALGCGLGQGYHLGRPAPADEIAALVQVP